ncbi:MAG: sorbosone dehydrogenase family protein [Gammaproteobacteria bacterium]
MSSRFQCVFVHLGALSLLCAAGAARAALAPALAGKVTVDTVWASGLSQVTDVAFAGDGRAVITRKTGQIAIRQADGSLVQLVYPLGGTLDTGSEKGLLGVVADPEVASNGAFYFYVSNGPGNADKNRVVRAVLTAANSFIVDPTPIVGATNGLPGLEGPANHDGGGLWIHDGRLYVGVGDTGANASPPVNKYGSCLNKPNGKILRVELNGEVPADNPLVGVAAVTACASPTGAWTTAAPDPRIYAWGLRNPWRLWVDPATGRVWIGDVGEGSSEEVSIGGAGLHYGYPFVEGARDWGDVEGLSCSSMTPSRACTPPAFAYDHAVGSAITGGLALDSAAWQAALGGVRYVFGDSSAHWVRSLPVNAARSGFASTTTADFAQYAGSRPVSFRLGPDGALYVAMLGAGAIHRYAPIVAPVPDAERVPATPLVFAIACGIVLAAVASRRLRRPVE